MMRLPHARQKRILFRWNGRTVEGREGDSVAAALYARGIRLLVRSRKRHRPQGLSGSFIGSVLARVDGRPNVRLDLEPLRQGLNVRMQNAWPSSQFDLLALVQLLPARWLNAGFEHDIWVRNDTRRYQIWEHILAYLAGIADPPAKTLPTSAIAGERFEADVVVIGGGPAGCQAASEAARQGQSVILVTRGETLARFAGTMGASRPALNSRVKLLSGMEAFGLYRRGSLVGCAPARHDGGAAAIMAQKVVIASGQRSWPPVVPGNDLPGVLDAHSAMALASEYAVAPGRSVFVVGTGAEASVAERLRALGVNVVGTSPVSALRRILGRSGVRAVETGRHVQCDSVIHAGPWRGDPNFAFQAESEGLLQLRRTVVAGQVRSVGSAGGENEPIAIDSHRDTTSMICACMDVSTDELSRRIETGETDVEVLKRLTACGMGPCQGTPCWDAMAACLASLTGAPAESLGRPSYRDPRRAITVAQAAGLDALIEPER